MNLTNVETEYAREPNSRVFLNSYLVKENTKLGYNFFSLL